MEKVFLLYDIRTLSVPESLMFCGILIIFCNSPVLQGLLKRQYDTTGGLPPGTPPVVINQSLSHFFFCNGKKAFLLCTIRTLEVWKSLSTKAFFLVRCNKCLLSMVNRNLVPSSGPDLGLTSAIFFCRKFFVYLTQRSGLCQRDPAQRPTIAFLLVEYSSYICSPLQL